MTAVFQDIVKNERRLDALRVRQTGVRNAHMDNVDIIVLAHPIALPHIPWMFQLANGSPILKIVASKRPNAPSTILWLGLSKKYPRGQLFDPVSAPDDFLGLDNGEC